MGEASLHGGLAGQPWAAALRAWELGPSSLGARGSPTPVEDVMKLPKEDMATLGRWPAWDTFALVTCARCDRNVKLEVSPSTTTTTSTTTNTIDIATTTTTATTNTITTTTTNTNTNTISVRESG